MKNAIVLILLTSLSINQSTDYSGTWVNSGDKFENKLTLEKIEGDLNIYKFSFDSWRKSYDSFTDQEVKFLGGMNDEVFIIELDENQAVYSDDLREFEEGWSLYNEGEQRCKVYFEFNKDSIKVKTEACSLIYAGFGVSFDGLYEIF
tara:strand:- start:107 stop:547 length:441 start_codon:yes stop_codon:yes gene_type:complete